MKEQRSGSRRPVRLIHTSDVHLGDGSGHPYALKALSAVVDAAPRLGGNLLLLVGDIFDNARVSDEIVQDFLDEIGRLDMPAVVLPGNHDLYGEGSIYCRDVFLEKPANLCVIEGADGEAVHFPDLTLDVWGRAMLSHTPEFRPLQGMPGRRDGHWLVALAHGHYHYDNDPDLRSSPIFPSEVVNATCDYLALGHWDRHVDVSHGGVTAIYSGTARGPSSNNYLGDITVVDLDPASGVSYRQVSL